MWKSAASLCCPGTERRTAAWMFCRLIARWPSWLRQRGRATITSTLLSLTASTGRLLSSSPLTLCRAPRLTFGGLSLTTAARPWSCWTNWTSQTLPGYGQSVIYCFIAIDLLTPWSKALKLLFAVSFFFSFSVEVIWTFLETFFQTHTAFTESDCA